MKSKLIVEVAAYGVVGGMTTLLNLILYFLLESWFGMHYIAADIIAWIVCFFFSFMASKICVFKNSGRTLQDLLRELYRFLTSSVFTGVIDVGLLYGMIDVMQVDGTVAKITDNVIIIILNYILRKCWVFNEEGKN